MALDFGPLVLALLVLESLLLVATVVLIVLSSREARQRVDLVDKLVDTADVLSRKEYFATSVAAIQDADDRIEGMVTGSPPTGQAAQSIDRILDAIRHATDRGVTVRYILPLGQERLQMAHRYEQAGAEIRFHPGLLASDARFMVVDGDTVVIGFPEAPGERQPTRRGQRVYSEKVATLFLDDLDAKWHAEETMTYDAYLARVVQDVVRSHPETSPRRIAQDLHVPESQVETALETPDSPARRDAAEQAA